MRLLFDLAHPAHVHLFRHLIERVRREGGEALVAMRDKDVALPLCDAFGIPYRVVTRAGDGSIGSNLGELLRRTVGVLQLARRFRPDALVGPSASIGLVGRLIGRPSFVFCEDDAAVVPHFARLAYPLARYVVTPACLAFEDRGARHLTYRGYHELAYLHPDHFTPDPARLRALSLSPGDTYFVLRFVSLTGHHDRNAAGIPLEVARALVAALAARGRVLITSEGALDEAFEPYRFPLPAEAFHDVLAHASLYVGDSQTLAAEAAVLGVPSLRCNSFVGRISYLEELEKTYGLTLGVPAGEARRLPGIAAEWLADLPALLHDRRTRRARLLAETVNVAEWQWRMLRERVRAR